MNIFKLLISGVCFFGLFAVVNAKPQQNNQAFQIAKGPPAHAKAHGYRKKRLYHYYPGAQVYFDSGRGLYFYLSGGSWVSAVTLPSKLKLKLGSSVELELETDSPFHLHHKHKLRFR